MQETESWKCGTFNIIFSPIQRFCGAHPTSHGSKAAEFWIYSQCSNLIKESFWQKTHFCPSNTNSNQKHGCNHLKDSSDEKRLHLNFLSHKAGSFLLELAAATKKLSGLICWMLEEYKFLASVFQRWHRVVWDILLSPLIQVCTKLTFAIKNTIIFTIKYFGMWKWS